MVMVRWDRVIPCYTGFVGGVRVIVHDTYYVLPGILFNSTTTECHLKTFISYYMFYTLHVVAPLRYDSVLIKETNE